MTKQTSFQKRQEYRKDALASVQSLCVALTNGNRFGRNLDGSPSLAFQIGYLQGIIANLVADATPANRKAIMAQLAEYTAAQQETV